MFNSLGLHTRTIHTKRSRQHDRFTHIKVNPYLLEVPIAGSKRHFKCFCLAALSQCNSIAQLQWLRLLWDLLLPFVLQTFLSAWTWVSESTQRDIRVIVRGVKKCRKLCPRSRSAAEDGLNISHVEVSPVHFDQNNQNNSLEPHDCSWKQMSNLTQRKCGDFQRKESHWPFLHEITRTEWTKSKAVEQWHACTVVETRWPMPSSKCGYITGKGSRGRLCIHRNGRDWMLHTGYCNVAQSVTMRLRISPMSLANEGFFFFFTSVCVCMCVCCVMCACFEIDSPSASCSFFVVTLSAWLWDNSNGHQKRLRMSVLKIRSFGYQLSTRGESQRHNSLTWFVCAATEEAEELLSASTTKWRDEGILFVLFQSRTEEYTHYIEYFEVTTTV